MNGNREKLRQEIIKRIEEAFPGSVVAWLGNGSPDDNYNDDSEQFEAYMIAEKDSIRFQDFVWDLYLEFGKPNGFSIMVFDLDPDATVKYRYKEYQAEKAKRASLTRVESERLQTWCTKPLKVGKRAHSVMIPAGYNIAKSPWQARFSAPTDCPISTAMDEQAA